jgi:hypothetical protein
VTIKLDVENDTTAPVFSPVDTRTFLTFSGTVADESGIKEVLLSLDGGPNEVVGKESWSYTLDVTEMKEGVHTLILQATDNAGNKQSMMHDFKLPLGNCDAFEQKINEFIISADKAQMHLDAAQKELDEIK